MKGRGFLLLGILAGLLSSIVTPAQAAFEVVAKAEVDSNVNRSIDQPESDGFFGVQLLTEKQPTGESRLEWVYVASLDAASYVRFDDLNYAEFSLSPGLLYRPHIVITAAVYPFVQARAVRDSAQSAVTLGTHASLSEQLSRAFSLTQYYAYRQGFANDDTYSYGMQSAGLVGSLVLARNLVGDISYEFSYGDSFRGIGPRRGRGEGGGSGPGQEGRGRFSPAFGQRVIKEKVTGNAFGFGLQLDLGLSWMSTLRYVYTSWRGDSGTSSSHLGSFSVGRRF